MYKKLGFGIVAGVGDIGTKVAMYNYINGGTWSPAEFCDWNTWKHFFTALPAIALTCWTGIPFYIARRAYYADKSWPVEMRRGYSSPLNALARIPFEEGPLYLFKGGLPVAVHAFFFYIGFFSVYGYLKNKSFWTWTYHEFNYNYIKTGNMIAAFIWGTVFSYPFYHVREMVDLWPKERGGHCTFNNSYA